MQELCEVTKSDGDCCYSDNGDYNVCQNYNEIQQRNEFDIEYDIVLNHGLQDQFGFDFDQSDAGTLEGFGTDDLFFNAETKFNGPSQRNSDDYAG